MKLMDTLHEIISADNSKDLQKALRSGAEIDGLDSKGYGPIHWAAYHGSTECLQTLLWYKADCGVQCRQGWTAAHIAAIRGESSAIEVLARAGANMMTKTGRGSTPLHMAAAHGHPKALQSLLRTGADINVTDILGWTPAHHAAFHGRLGCLQVLHKWGAILDMANIQDGNTPVHLAASEGHLPCVQFLTSLTCEGPSHVLLAVNNHGSTACHLAQQFCKHDVVQFLTGIDEEGPALEQKQRGENLAFPAHAAAFAGNLDELIELVERGIVTINERDDQGATPAHKAAGTGHVNCLQWLIENGADVTARNRSGETPQHVATRFAQAACLHLLERTQVRRKKKHVDFDCDDSEEILDEHERPVPSRRMPRGVARGAAGDSESADDFSSDVEAQLSYEKSKREFLEERVQLYHDETDDLRRRMHKMRVSRPAGLSPRGPVPRPRLSKSVTVSKQPVARRTSKLKRTGSSESDGIFVARNISAPRSKQSSK